MCFKDKLQFELFLKRTSNPECGAQFMFNENCTSSKISVQI